MASNEYIFYIILLCVVAQVFLVQSQSDMKSSLAFVIDSTMSMWDDIDAVKKSANDIFDTVQNSNASHIENFVLVTFRDPDVFVVSVTKDRQEFKQALYSLNLVGNDDCPEMSMTGILEAIRISRTGSYFYVFTDAAAKDYRKYETVRQLAVEKGAQINFVLTGECPAHDTTTDKVYYSLAKDTNGLVFNLYKNEVEMILNYVKYSVKGRGIDLFSGKYSAGSHTFNYTVDSNVKEIAITLTGANLKIDVTDPEGSPADTEVLVNTAKINIVTIKEVKPGVYKAEISSDRETTVKVSGTNTLHFQHGFSRLEPESIEETAHQPIPDEELYLSIKLTSGDGAVELQSVVILDLNNNIIKEMPLELVNVDDQFYIAEPTVMPKSPFRIAIKGLDVMSKTVMMRYGVTPIEPLNLQKVKSTNKPPTVSILGKTVVHAVYEAPLQLKCKISAFPKPAIIWEGADDALSTSTVTQVEIPYDYLSILEIDVVNSNKTYTCKATNNQGSDSKHIQVYTKRTKYFDILETPKDATIDYEKSASFVCKVNADPPAEFSWYKDGKRLRRNDFYDIETKESSSILTLTDMQLHMAGKFWCKAKNDYNRKLFIFKVSVSGVEVPLIEKNVTEVFVEEGSDAKITCRILQGNPKPIISWFFQSISSDVFEEISGNETIFLKSVDFSNAGLYRCEAFNKAGRDFHYTELVIQYPPDIVESKRKLSVVLNTLLKLPCEVYSEPPPTVQWYKNGIKITKSPDYRQYKDHTLSFVTSKQSSGEYTCTATNYLGNASKSILVEISVPATIKRPKDYEIQVLVGSHLKLECLADGDPKPNIVWRYHRLDFSVPPKMLNTHNNGVLIYNRIQPDKEGYYTCIASNIAGKDEITYEVQVLSAPYIIPNNKKHIKAVNGDLALRIPCKVLGHPKPEVIWTYDNVFQLPTGSEWYDIDKENTLTIKNIDREAQGSYTCSVQNKFGTAAETSFLTVLPYPERGFPSTSIDIEEGKSIAIPCDVRHTRVDRVRWYKDQKFITHGELGLKNVSVTDSGLYTCRVSNLADSKSLHTLIKVGFKPRFINDAKEYIKFEEGVIAFMDCAATGNPTPKVSWWHDNNQINETQMSYNLVMKLEKRGQYICLVENRYGSVVRNFEISTKECTLNIKSDLTRNQPLLVSTDLNLPLFENIDGILRIPFETKVVLSCPEQFLSFPKTEIDATCKQGKEFLVDGNTHKFSDLNCRRAIDPIVQATGNACYMGNTEMIKIGYKVKGKFINAYQICLDKNLKVPVYAKYTIHRSMSIAEVTGMKWINNKLITLDFDSAYDCDFQQNKFQDKLGRWLSNRPTCCFSKRQLVNPRDMLPGLAQVATYSTLNVVPQWSSCQTKNWQDVEIRIRRLARSTTDPLLIWTGTAQQLMLKGPKTWEFITITDRFGRGQSVPRYLWKVIQNPATRSSLVIIQVNVPDLKQSEVSQFIRCHDECKNIPWMASGDWNNVSKGYIYCCNIADFETNFSYSGVFQKGFNNLLVDV